MNTLVIVLTAAVVLVAAYALYGRWLAKTWGIDPKAQTPAVKYNDGKDFVPTNGWTVFSHQFSSIAGAGPVTGAIQAAAFGWLPVLLWVLLGGVFFGAVTDFGALYASVKNDGKSMGMLIEKYIGKLGRKLFLLFCWLFCLIVIAAFADMVAGTFNAYTVVDGVTQLADAAQTNGAAGMVSIMFMVFAVVFGLVQKKLNLSGWKEAVLGILCIVASFAVGMNCPLIFGKATWSYITFVYIFFAAVLPMWLLKQPRDYMTTFMFICMIAGAVVGLLVAHPTMNLPVFTGFNNEKLGTMFPILFVTVACGAVSGFHSLVSSGTSSKTVENEKDMLKVGYGAMILESLLAVLALCVAGAAAALGQLARPFVGGVGGGFGRAVAGGAGVGVTRLGLLPESVEILSEPGGGHPAFGARGLPGVALNGLFGARKLHGTVLVEGGVLDAKARIPEDLRRIVLERPARNADLHQVALLLDDRHGRRRVKAAEIARGGRGGHLKRSR